MATLEVEATVDGYIQSRHTIYSTAREGGSLSAVTSAQLYVGQFLDAGGYYCLQALLNFDTSLIPDGATVTAAVLSLFAKQVSTGWTVEARAHDFGASIDTGDWVAGSSLSGKTLLATIGASSLVDEAQNEFASKAEFPAAINKSGATRILLCSSRQKNNQAPSGYEYAVFEDLESGGAGEYAKLTVTYTTPVPVIHQHRQTQGMA